MKLFIPSLLFILFFNSSSLNARVVEDCPTGTKQTVIDRLAANIEKISDKYNGCEQVPKKDRKLKSHENSSTAKVLLDMAGGCFVGLLKGFIAGLKDIITSFWDLTKLGYKLAKKFGKKMVNYLYLAYKSGITTLFSEYARDTSSFLKTVLNGLKAIPELILDAGVKQVETFKCLNSKAKADYVCKTMSYLGTDVLLAVLTGGASKIAYVSKLQSAIKLGVRAQKLKIVKKATPLLKGPVAKQYVKRSLKGFDAKKAEKLIEKGDEVAKSLKGKLDAKDSELLELVDKFKLTAKGPARDPLKGQIKARSVELRQITKELSDHNTSLSHLRTKKLIHDLDAQGSIEITRVIPDGKIINDADVAKGRYPPWSEGGPVYEIRVKKRVEFCRGGAAGEAINGAGRWFLPCATKNYRSKNENRWVNATADNPYDEFAKYKLKEGDIVQVGGINPILNAHGGQRVFRDKKSGKISTVRGGGGEVQVFRPDTKKLSSEDLVRTVKVYNDQEIRTLQAQLARVKNKEEALVIKRKISKRSEDDEAASFLLEVEDKISGLSGVSEPSN